MAPNASTPNSSTTTLGFSCACRRVTGSAKVPTSKLPLPLVLCHCNICRHQSGLLCASYSVLPEGTTDISFEGPIVNYRSSEIVTRSFCNHCGANVHVQYANETRPDVCTGVFNKADGVLQTSSHIFLPDSKDDGLAAWISDIPAYEGFSNQAKLVEYKTKDQVQVTSIHATELHGYCQCKGVQFRVLRPSAVSDAISSPWPDLIMPYVSESSENKNDVKWWLRANGNKYLAGTCACTSCRLASGFDIQTWAFIPRTNILQRSGKSLDFRIGTLKQYKSSQGVYREFCSDCGATVFWHCDERPELIDVSAGLLDANEGARAESWLEWWTDRVSFEEEAQNKDLISRLSAGMKRLATAQGST